MPSRELVMLNLPAFLAVPASFFASNSGQFDWFSEFCKSLNTLKQSFDVLAQTQVDLVLLDLNLSDSKGLANHLRVGVRNGAIGEVVSPVSIF